MILLSYLAVLVKSQDEIQWALTRVAREASAEYGVSGNKVLVNRLYCQKKLNDYLGTGGNAVSLAGSEIVKKNDEIDLIATYRVKLPFRLLQIQTCRFRQRVHTRAFTGVERREGDRTADQTIVYITETGRVYHRRRDCTYLQLSISQMKYEDIPDLRNEGGGKYKPCERCTKKRQISSQTAVWITNYGDCYHISRSCSGIRRSIKKTELSKVGKRTPCSKCGT